MSIKITQATRYEGKVAPRSVKLQARFSDEKGYGEIIDMLVFLADERGWSMRDVMDTAMAQLYDYVFDTEEAAPVTPTSQNITAEMGALVKQAKALQGMALELMEKALSGSLSVEAGNTYKAQMAEISSSIDVIAVEGAGNYASQVTISDKDDDSWGW